MPSPEPDPQPPGHLPRSRPSRGLIGALVALLCLIWGSTWFVIQAGLRDLPPLTSVSVRFVIAAIVMAGLVSLLRGRESGGPPRPLLWVTLGTLNFAGSYCIVYLSETTLPSGLVSVLWSIYPMLMAICGHLFLPGEHLRARHWVGFTLGFLGILLLFQTDLRELGPDAVPMAAFLLLSPTITAIGTTVIKRYGESSSSLLMNRNALFLASVLLIGPVLLFERDAPVEWTAQAIGATVYLAVIGTVVTFGLFFWLLRHTPAYRLGLIAYVTPVIALALGWMFGGEPVTVFTLSGAGLVLLGVLFVVRK